MSRLKFRLILKNALRVGAFLRNKTLLALVLFHAGLGKMASALKTVGSLELAHTSAGKHTGRTEGAKRDASYECA